MWRFIEFAAQGISLLFNGLFLAIEYLWPLGDRGRSHVAAWRIAFLMLAPVIAWGMIIYLLPSIYLATPGGRDLVHRLAEADRVHLTPMVFDARQRFIMALPFFNLERANLDEEFRQREAFFGRRYTGQSTFVPTVFVERPNPHYLACIRHLEDRTGSWRSPYGVDVFLPARAAYHGLTSDPIGGSTLPAQFQQQIGFNKGDENKYVRKFEELLFRTPAMADLASRHSAAFDQLAGRALPHAMALGGGFEIRGIELAARLYFGRPQEQLSRAQAYVIAAATRSPPIFRYGMDENRSLVDNRDQHQWRWSGNRDCSRGAICRARLCAAQDSLVPSGEERRSVMAELEQMRQVGTPLPRAAPLIEQLGTAELIAQGRDSRRWYTDARNPFIHARALMQDSIHGVVRELEDAFDVHWGSLVNRVTLSTDVADEHRFHRRFDAAVRDWLRQQDRLQRLNPVYRPWAMGGSCEGLQSVECPDVVLAVADPDGRIVRFYASRQQGSYYGLRRGGAPYDWREEDRQIASVAKVGAALIFARANLDIGEIEPLMAASNTGAIELQLQRRISCGGREAFASTCFSDEVREQLRWSTLSSRPQGGRIENPSREFSRGTLAASPRTVHHDMSALLNAFLGRDAPVPAPTIVRSVTYLDYPAGRLSAPRPRLPDYEASLSTRAPLLRPSSDRPGETFPAIEAALASPESFIRPSVLVPPGDRQDLLRLLRAPVCYRRGASFTGTLRGLSHWCDRARILFGKTGTYDISAEYRSLMAGAGSPGAMPARMTGVAHTLWAAGGIQTLDGRAYSFVLMIAGSTQRTPIAVPRSASAPDLEGGAMAPLLDLVLNDTLGQIQ